VDSNDTDISYQHTHTKVMQGVGSALNRWAWPFVKSNEPKLAINPLIHRVDGVHEGGKEGATNDPLKWDESMELV
jgi:hypothetical protein